MRSFLLSALLSVASFQAFGNTDFEGCGRYSFYNKHPVGRPIFGIPIGGLTEIKVHQFTYKDHIYDLEDMGNTPLETGAQYCIKGQLDGNRIIVTRLEEDAKSNTCSFIFKSAPEFAPQGYAWPEGTVAAEWHSSDNGRGHYLDFEHYNFQVSTYSIRKCEALGAVVSALKKSHKVESFYGSGYRYWW